MEFGTEKRYLLHLASEPSTDPGFALNSNRSYAAYLALKTEELFNAVHAYSVRLDLYSSANQAPNEAYVLRWAKAAGLTPQQCRPLSTHAWILEFRTREEKDLALRAPYSPEGAPCHGVTSVLRGACYVYATQLPRIPQTAAFYRDSVLQSIASTAVEGLVLDSTDGLAVEIVSEVLYIRSARRLYRHTFKSWPSDSSTAQRLAHIAPRCPLLPDSAPRCELSNDALPSSRPTCVLCEGSDMVDVGVLPCKHEFICFTCARNMPTSEVLHRANLWCPRCGKRAAAYDPNTRGKFRPHAPVPAPGVKPEWADRFLGTELQPPTSTDPERDIKVGEIKASLTFIEQTALRSGLLDSAKIRFLALRRKAATPKYAGAFYDFILNLHAQAADKDLMGRVYVLAEKSGWLDAPPQRKKKRVEIQPDVGAAVSDNELAPPPPRSPPNSPVPAPKKARGPATDAHHSDSDTFAAPLQQAEDDMWEQWAHLSAADHIRRVGKFVVHSKRHQLRKLDPKVYYESVCGQPRLITLASSPKECYPSTPAIVHAEPSDYRIMPCIPMKEGKNRVHLTGHTQEYDDLLALSKQQVLNQDPNQLGYTEAQKAALRQQLREYKGSQFYVIWQGPTTGVFSGNWSEISQLTRGVKGCKYRQAPTYIAAHQMYARLTVDNQVRLLPTPFELRHGPAPTSARTHRPAPGKMASQAPRKPAPKPAIKPELLTPPQSPPGSPAPTLPQHAAPVKVPDAVEQAVIALRAKISGGEQIVERYPTAGAKFYSVVRPGPLGQTCICADYTLAVYHSGRTDFGSAVRPDLTIEEARARIKLARGDISYYLIGVIGVQPLPNEVALEPLNTDVPMEPLTTPMVQDTPMTSPPPAQDTRDASGSAPQTLIGHPLHSAQDGTRSRTSPSRAQSKEGLSPTPMVSSPRGSNLVGAALNPEAPKFTPSAPAPAPATTLVQESPPALTKGSQDRSPEADVGVESPAASESDSGTPPTKSKRASYAAALKGKGDSDLSDDSFEKVKGTDIQPVTARLAKSNIGPRVSKVTDFFPVAGVSSNNNSVPKPGSMPLQNRFAQLSDSSSQSDSDPSKPRRSGRLKGRK
jgi:hypothetical protein